MSKPKKDAKNITATQIWGLLEGQAFKCAMSGLPLEPETTSLDHKIPLARGGTHDIGNVWLVHQRINTAKGTLTTEEFVEMCREVVEHHARTAGIKIAS